MTTYYHRFYNAPRPKDRAGISTSFVLKARALGNSTEKQVKYYTNLVDFLNQHGIETGWLGKPRNNRDCSSKIQSLLTVLHKNGLDTEFFSAAEEGGDGE